MTLKIVLMWGFIALLLLIAYCYVRSGSDKKAPVKVEKKSTKSNIEQG